MLKHDDPRFLDDMTIEQLANELETQILPVEGVEGLVKVLLNETGWDPSRR